MAEPAVAVVDLTTCTDTKFLLEHAANCRSNAIAMQKEHTDSKTLTDDRVTTIKKLNADCIIAKNRADSLYNMDQSMRDVDAIAFDPVDPANRPSPVDPNTNQPMGTDGASLLPTRPADKSQSAVLGVVYENGKPSYVRVGDGSPGEMYDWKMSPAERTSGQEFRKWMQQGAPRIAKYDAAQNWQAPIEFSAGVKMLCRDRLWLRRLATTWSIRQAAKLAFRMEAHRPKSASWGCTPCDSIENPDRPQWDQKVLEPHHNNASVDLCREDLIQASIGGFNLQAYIAEAISRDIAEIEETAFFTGDGQGKPLGILYNPVTPGVDYGGLDDTNDIESIGIAAIEVNDLIAAQWSLPECCRFSPSLAWMFPPEIVAQLMMLEDGQNRSYWVLSMSAGLPSTLFGMPVYDSQYFPSTATLAPGGGLTSGDYYGILADFAGYYIGDGLTTELERDDTPKTNLATWYYRGRTDGMPYRKECFKRLKLQ